MRAELRGIWLVARRELAAYVNSPWGWVIGAALLLADGLFFNAFAVTSKPRMSTEVLEDFFRYSFGLGVVAALLLTMRLLAEERQTGTMVLLDASPLSDRQVVVGKWLSATAVLWALTAMTVYMPVLIMINGKVSVGQLVAGYLGLFLSMAGCTAVGTFGSAVARNQLVALVISGGLMLLLIVSWLLAKLAEAPLDDVFAYLAYYDRHFIPFRKGRINSEDVTYYASVCLVFLVASVRVLSTRRWR